MKPGEAITQALQQQERRDLAHLAIEVARRYLSLMPTSTRWLFEGLGKHDYNAPFPSMHRTGRAVDAGDVRKYVD